MKKIIYSLLFLAIAVSCKTNNGGNSLVIQLEPKSNSNVNGTATFVEKNGEVVFTTKISGLKPGKHAIHLHEKATLLAVIICWAINSSVQGFMS